MKRKGDGLAQLEKEKQEAEQKLLQEEAEKVKLHFITLYAHKYIHTT
jgi:hypothetical protein